MPSFEPDDILNSTSARIVWGKPQQAQGVSIDSRTIEKGQLFIAIRGKRYDGHAFVAEVLEKGAAGAMVSKWPLGEIPSWQDAPIWKVPDTMIGLGQLARSHRDRFKVDLIAITGSSGKSTAKSMLAHILSGDKQVLATPGTQNNQIGVPLTLLRLEERHQAVVLELGTNQWGELAALTRISGPTVGAVINIGPAHLETFGDLKGVLRAKGELWDNLAPRAPLVLNAEDPLLAEAGQHMSRPMTWFGWTKKSDVWASAITYGPLETRCRVNGRWDLRLPLPGAHNLLNALAALACAKVVGQSLEAGVERLSSFSGLPGRLQRLERNGVLVIDDSYNANPASLKAALEVLKGLQTKGQKVLAIGDMLELGAHTRELHEEAGRWVAAAAPGLVVAVGPMARHLLAAAWEQGLPPQAGRAFDSPDEAGEFLQGVTQPGDAVLVKGSRAMQMERVLACFTNSSIH